MTGGLLLSLLNTWNCLGRLGARQQSTEQLQGSGGGLCLPVMVCRMSLSLPFTFKSPLGKVTEDGRSPWCPVVRVVSAHVQTGATCTSAWALTVPALPPAGHPHPAPEGAHAAQQHDAQRHPALLHHGKPCTQGAARLFQHGFNSSLTCSFRKCPSISGQACAAALLDSDMPGNCAAGACSYWCPCLGVSSIKGTQPEH
jgi:hypothetical protein